MMYPYRCDSCGCYLDPGEGRICDECQQNDIERRVKRQHVQNCIQLFDGMQYEFNLDGGFCYEEH